MSGKLIVINNKMYAMCNCAWLFICRNFCIFIFSTSTHQTYNLFSTRDYSLLWSFKTIVNNNNNCRTLLWFVFFEMIETIHTTMKNKLFPKQNLCKMKKRKKYSRWKYKKTFLVILNLIWNKDKKKQ